MFGTPLNDTDDAAALAELQDFLDHTDPDRAGALRVQMQGPDQLSYAQNMWITNYETVQSLTEEIRDGIDTVTGVHPDVVARLTAVFERYFEAATLIFGTADDHLQQAAHELDSGDAAQFAESLARAEDCEVELRQRVFDIEGLRARAFGEFDGFGNYTSPDDRRENNRAIITEMGQVFAARYARFPADAFTRAQREEDAMVEIWGPNGAG